MTIGELRFLKRPPDRNSLPLSPLAKKPTIHFNLEFKNPTQMPIRFLVLMSPDDPTPDSVLEFFKQASVAIDLKKERKYFPCLKRNEYALFIYDEVLCMATRIQNLKLQNKDTLHIEIQMAGEIAIKTAPKIKE